MQGRDWDGLLPISSTGSRHSRWCPDLGRVACAWQARRSEWQGRAPQRQRAPTTRALSACDLGQGRNSVTTHFLVSRPGLAKLVLRHTSRCRDTVGFHGVATWLAFMVSRPIVCVATHFLTSRHGLAKLVSRHGFGVATWSGFLGVVT